MSCNSFEGKPSRIVGVVSQEPPSRSPQFQLPKLRPPFSFQGIRDQAPMRNESTAPTRQKISGRERP